MAIYTGVSKSKLFTGNTKVKRMYLGNEKIYSAGNIVTYIVDTNISYQEEVDEGNSVLSPKTFTPSKAGWTFAGWQTDKTASTPLSSMIMEDNPITLYAVFTQTITLSYNGNGNTGGSVAAQTGLRYYNNGSINNPSFILKPNTFTRNECTFKKWSLGSTGGTQYAAGASVTISVSTVMYAIWSGVNKNIVNSLLLNVNYISNSNGSLPDYTHTLWSNLNIDCSLYKAVQITTKQVFAETRHEMTGVTFGIYESGGNYLPIAYSYKEAGSVGGALHKGLFVADGSTATLNFKNTSGITKLYLGLGTYNGSARWYGSAFIWVTSVTLIGR